MFRIASPDGHTRQSQTVRGGLTIAYTMYALAGLGLLLSPVVADVYGPASWAYSTFIFLGGLFSGVGTFTRRWLGEFIGLPLLISAFAAFGLEVYPTDFATAPFLSAALALLLWGVAALSFARWRISLATYRMVHHLARTEKGLP